MNKEETSEIKCPKVKTINLAEEGNSLDERRTKLLVYERELEPVQPVHGAQMPVGVKTTPKTAKRIRICTAADVKKMCPPPLCDCPPKLPPLTALGMVKKIVSFGVRGAIVGAVVLWTIEMGIWGDARKTEEIYVNVKNKILGKEFDPKDGSPRMDRAVHTTGEKWNRFVTTTFGFIAGVSNTVGSLFVSEKCEPDNIKKEC